MAQKIIDGDRIVSLGTVDCEEDLKPQPGIISLNPPPGDGRCDCCLRHISELEPFGGPGDPLVGDFTGCFLVKTWRPVTAYDEESEKLVEEAEGRYKEEGFADIFEYLQSKYGEEEAEKILCTVEASHTVGSSWECRDCLVLDDDEYFEKKFRIADENISDNSNAGNRAD